jgi:hypothetical protein
LENAVLALTATFAHEFQALNTKFAREIQALKAKSTESARGIQDLKAKIQDLKAKNTKDGLIWGSDLLKNVSAQILLFWINEPHKEFSQNSEPKHRFRIAVQKKSIQFLNLAAALGQEEAEFATGLDRMLIRRNRSIHFPNWSDLGTKVKQLQGLLKRSRRLRAQNVWSAFVIRNYSVFRQHHDQDWRI